MNQIKKTKIIATIGPASDSHEKITKLIETGVNIFRFNMKHNVPDWHLERIKRVDDIAQQLNKNIGILIDLQGPEIRISTNNEDVSLKENENFVLTDRTELPKEYDDYKKIYLTSDVVLKTLNEGNEFSIDDGFYEFKVVTKVDDNILIVKSYQTATIKHRKSLNLVGIDVPLPSLIDEDLDKLDMATKTQVDFVALSFTRSKKDIDVLKKEMKKRKLDCKIIAKVESKAGVVNIDEIIENCDGVMIARGDLGVEIPMEELPFLQKEMIKKCREANKPVIVATQMLQSMTQNPIPTRAEAADVANAIFDETDAIMLSGETASGNYPERAVNFMATMALYNENKMLCTPEENRLCAGISSGFTPSSKDQTHAVVKAAMSLLNKKSGVEISKILVFSESGYTARVVSSFRPSVPVIAFSETKSSVDSLTLSYGITSFIGDFAQVSDNYKNLFENLIEKGLLYKGEHVVIIHGNRWQEHSKTNAMVILTA